MFYRPGIDGHGLAHDPFKALVSPRPIGWISTRDRAGHVNLAPYSFFNAVADDPPMVMYCNTGAKSDRVGGKDTLANIHESGVFVANVVGYALRDAMNLTSGLYAADVDEFALAGLTPAPGRVVAVPRVAEAPAALECRLWKIVDLPGPANHMVIGEVVGVHISDAVLVDGRVDVTLYKPLARLGYRDYAVVESPITLNRPGQT